jgi:hypothetical protein
MFDYSFFKETIQFLTQIGTLLTLVSPVLWAIWLKISKFVRDHGYIMERFDKVAEASEKIASDVEQVKKEFHNLNKAFREYSNATDERLKKLEEQNGYYKT